MPRPRKLKKIDEFDGFSENVEIIMKEAVHAGNVELIKDLLDSNPSLTDEYVMSLLRRAITHCHENIVIMLLEERPQLKRLHQNNVLSPLWIAILYGFLQIAEILVNAGVDVNETLGSHPLYSKSSSVLHVLTTSTSQLVIRNRLVELIIKRGANINAQDYNGATPLHNAVTMGLEVIVQLLLSEKADLSIADIRGELAFHTAVHSCYSEKMVQIFLNYVDPTIRDKNGRNALHHLARNGTGNLTLAKTLLDRGVSLKDTEQLSSCTPLHDAIANHKYELVELFLDWGADINARSKKGIFALYLAAKKDPSIVKLLLKRGVNIEERTNTGRTALHNACANNELNCIKLLIRCGAEINIKDSHGKTPFSLMACTTLNRPAMKIMIKEMVRLESMNPGICKDDITIIYDHPKLTKFFRKCVSEMKELKTEEFYNSISMYDLLTKSTYELSKLTKNKKFIFAYRISIVRDRFSIYKENIEFAMDKALWKRDLLLSLEKQLDSIFINYLPFCAIIKIAYFQSLDRRFIP